MFDGFYSRRSVLASVATVIGSSFSPAIANAEAQARHRKPNIIFILADDLGYADVSCYGRREYKTPAIDQLAKEGMRFTQAYANSAVCSATRTALMTGRYQNRLPIGLEEPLGSNEDRDLGLPPSHPTLPSLLRANGYRTALLGKWHLGKLPNYGPLKSGYDHFWGFRDGALDYFTHQLLGEDGLWDDDKLIRQPGYLTDLLGDKAIEMISSYAMDKAPFFISLHFNAPHFPWEGPDDEVEADRLRRKGGGAIYHTDGGSMKTFASMVTRMDMQIGRILSELDRLGIADDTIIVFTSDNGGERYSDTWPFSGKKTELLEGGLRIPAIVRWPGHIPANRINEQMIMTMDWMPTLLAAARAKGNPAYPPDGMDLSATLYDGAPPISRTLCWRYLNLSQEACRDGDWKYLKILGNTFLFNVVNDPLERANLKDIYPGIYRRLVESFRAWDQQMLPLSPESHTAGLRGQDIADHFGIANARTLETVPD
tara:strand:+ start:20756 stop:22207 length:1452 start_codon:yes stop_codon:yes gene_type:complete